MAMAQRATRIKICSHNHPDDCVTSRANTFPIHMLREGAAISHKAGLECDTSCVRETWEGERIHHLWSSCPVSHPDNVLNAQTTNLFFHACGNADGLHLSAVSGGPAYQCGWQHQQQDAIDVFINSHEDQVASTPHPTDQCRAIEEKLGQYGGVQELWATQQMDLIVKLWQRVAGENSSMECLSSLLHKLAGPTPLTYTHQHSAPPVPPVPTPMPPPHPPSDPSSLGSQSRPVQWCDQLIDTHAAPATPQSGVGVRVDTDRNVKQVCACASV